MTQSDQRLITFISWSGIILGFISMTGYLLLGSWIDTMYGAIAMLFFFTIFYLTNQKRISFNLASLLFCGFGIVLVTVGYITSSSIEDGLIYMIIPTIIISLLRPSPEALIWLLCYYAFFLVINLLHIPNYPISFNVFIQLFTIHMILYLIISYFRYQERALSRRLEILNRSLQEEVTLDALTGAYNRRAFEKIIEQSISLHVVSERPCVLAIIDVDYFKRINDTYGHPQGDMVLKALVKHIQSKIRKSDTLIRYGGEEFVICFENMQLSKAEEIMEKIRRSIEAMRLIKGEKITVSAGLSSLQKGDTPLLLLSRADSALYMAKDAGRNRIRSQ